MASIRTLFRSTIVQNFRSLTTSSSWSGQNLVPAPYKDPECKRLEGKVAVVTASTEGIGFAIAERFCQEGAQVVISSRKQENVDRAVGELKQSGHTVLGVPCHVGNSEQRQNLLDKTLDTFGGVDILVSNAAVNPAAMGLLNCPVKAWDKIFEINVTSPLMLSQLFAPHLKKKETDSAIMFVSSFVAFNVMHELSAYCVSKTTLLGLTKALALDLASTNVRVNCLAPGNVLTRFADPSIGLRRAAIAAGMEIPEEKMNEAMDTLNKSIVGGIPFGRSAVSHEMAGVAAFLCSEDASYITGETINAAGGILSRL